MTGTLLVSQLTDKYARLKGLYEFAERTIEASGPGVKAWAEAAVRIEAEQAELRQQMEHIAGVIRLYRPDWDGARVRPKYPKVHTRKIGIVARAAYRVMRASGHPLPVREIAKLVARRLEPEPLSEDEVAKIDSAIHGVMKRRDGKFVTFEGSKPRRWRLLTREEISSQRAAACSPRTSSIRAAA